MLSYVNATEVKCSYSFSCPCLGLRYFLYNSRLIASCSTVPRVVFYFSASSLQRCVFRQVFFYQKGANGAQTEMSLSAPYASYFTAVTDLGLLRYMFTRCCCQGSACVLYGLFAVLLDEQTSFNLCHCSISVPWYHGLSQQLKTVAK